MIHNNLPFLGTTTFRPYYRAHLISTCNKKRGGGTVILLTCMNVFYALAIIGKQDLQNQCRAFSDAANKSLSRYHFLCVLDGD